jgi:hypothetical protein
MSLNQRKPSSRPELSPRPVHMRGILPAAVGLLLLLIPVITMQQDTAAAACDPNYEGVCLPVFGNVDNINCDSPEVTQASFPSTGSDPYHLDSDHNGTACENNGRPPYQPTTRNFSARAVMVARDEPASPPTATPTPTGRPATPTATATFTPTTQSQPTATATSQPSAHTWYTSAASNAKYYYCDLDDGWKSLSPSNLRSYPSEAALIAAWGSSRVKHPSSKC